MISSLLFGVTHGILQQSISAALVGIVIGYVAVQTGSLLPGIVFHLVYNTLGVSAALERRRHGGRRCTGRTERPRSIVGW